MHVDRHRYLRHLYRSIEFKVLVATRSHDPLVQFRQRWRQPMTRPSCSPSHRFGDSASKLPTTIHFSLTTLGPWFIYHSLAFPPLTNIGSNRHCRLFLHLLPPPPPPSLRSLKLRPAIVFSKLLARSEPPTSVAAGNNTLTITSTLFSRAVLTYQVYRFQEPDTQLDIVPLTSFSIPPLHYNTYHGRLPNISKNSDFPPTSSTLAQLFLQERSQRRVQIKGRL